MKEIQTVWGTGRRKYQSKTTTNVIEGINKVIMSNKQEQNAIKLKSSYTLKQDSWNK